MTDRGQNVCVTLEYDCHNLCPHSTIFIWWVNTAPALTWSVTEHMLWPCFSILTLFSIVFFLLCDSLFKQCFFKGLYLQKKISTEQLLPHVYNLLSGSRSEHCLLSIKSLLMSVNRPMEEQMSCWYNVIKHLSISNRIHSDKKHF